MKKIYSAIFEIDDDPDVSNELSYAQSYLKESARCHAMKVEAFVKENAKEFHLISISK